MFYSRCKKSAVHAFTQRARGSLSRKEAFHLFTTDTILIAFYRKFFKKYEDILSIISTRNIVQIIIFRNYQIYFPYRIQLMFWIHQSQQHKLLHQGRPRRKIRRWRKNKRNRKNHKRNKTWWLRRNTSTITVISIREAFGNILTLTTIHCTDVECLLIVHVVVSTLSDIELSTKRIKKNWMIEEIW